jgi:integrase
LTPIRIFGILIEGDYMPKVGTKVFLRSDGRYCAKYKKGIDGKTGKTKYGYIYGKTALEVNSKLINTKSDLQKGMFIDRSGLTVSNWIEIWLQEYKRHSLKPSTFESYSFIFSKYIKPYIGEIKIQDLKSEQIQRFINDLRKQGLSPRTVIYAHRILSMSLEKAIDNDILFKNYARSASLPTNSKKEVRALNKEEQEKFVNALHGNTHEDAIKFLLSTGLRIGELLALKWSDFDLEKSEISVTKTLQRIQSKIVIGSPKTSKGNRKIPLLLQTEELLKEHKKRQHEKRLRIGEAWQNKNYIFTTNLGTPLDKDNINRTLKSICKKASIEPISAHILRHTFATRGFEAGIELIVMQNLLGHASLAVTADIYSHVLPDKKKESMEKLNGKFF